MSEQEKNTFNWSQSFRRDRFYTQYKPKVKIYSFFFLILPWFNLFLLAFAYVYFFHALSVVPGERVQLPVVESTHSGINSGLIITARPIYSRDLEDKNELSEELSEDSTDYQPSSVETLPPIIVFFKDERFNLSMPHRYVKFESKLRLEVQQKKQKIALLYADKNISLSDAMKLLEVVRKAGVEEVCFVEDLK